MAGEGPETNASAEASRQRTVDLEKLNERLSRVMRREFIADWLQRPNEAFDGGTPIELVERGQIARVLRLIEAVVPGPPG